MIADGDGVESVLEAVRSVYAPFSVVARRSPGTGSAALAGLAPFVEAQVALGDDATVYVCRDHVCNAPTTDGLEAARLLAESARE